MTPCPSGHETPPGDQYCRFCGMPIGRETAPNDAGAHQIGTLESGRPLAPASSRQRWLLAALGLGTAAMVAGGAFILFLGHRGDSHAPVGGPPVAAASGSHAAGGDSPVAGPAAVTIEALRGATLPDDACTDVVAGITRPLRLVDGLVPGIAPDKGFIQIPEQAGTAVGDLNGDGADDGVVVVQCNGGGSMVVNTVFVYLAGAGSIGRVPFENLVTSGSYAPAVESVGIAGGEITLRWSVFTADDPHCCPTRDVTGSFRVNGTSVGAVDHTVVDDASAAAAFIRAMNDHDPATAAHYADQPAIDQLARIVAQRGTVKPDSVDPCHQPSPTDSPPPPADAVRTCPGDNSAAGFDVFLIHPGFGQWRAIAAIEFHGE